MFRKVGLLQPHLWPVRVGPTWKGGISWQGTGVPPAGCCLGSLAWISFSSSLGCSHTHSHTSCSIDKSRKWVAAQPAEAQLGGERLLLSVHIQDGMRRLWVACDEWKTREGLPKPMPNLSPTFILNFIFVPIFKNLFPPNFKSFFP